MNVEATRDPRAAVLAALPVGVIAFDATGRLTLANPALLALLGDAPPPLPTGLGREEALRRLAEAGLFGEGPPEGPGLACLAPAVEAPATFVTARGRRVEWRPARLADGGLMIALPETTALSRRLEDVARHTALLESMLDHLNSGVALYGHDGLLRFANAAFPRRMGIAPADARPGTPLESVLEATIAAGEFPPDEVEAVRARVRTRAWTRDAAWERQRPNGEVLRVLNHPLGGGDWLAEVTDITAERRAEQEARRRIALQDALFDALPVGVAVYGADRVLRYVNPAYNAILADSPVRVGEHLRDILMRRALAGEFGPGDPEEQVALRVARVAGPFHFERLRPGGQVTVHRSVPLPDGGHAMVVADVSELTAAQAAARERTELLATMLESTRHGIVLFDAEGRVVIANRLAARFCGLPPDAFAPGVHVTALRERMVAAGAYGTPEQAARVIAARGPEVLRAADSYRRQGADGRVVEVATDRLPSGGHVRSFTDVTALVRAEEEASARAATLQTVLDSMRHGVILYDATGHVRTSNSLAARLAGLPVERLRPGVHFDTLRDIQTELGEHGPGEAGEAYRRNRVREPWKGDSTYVRTRPDGTIVEVRTDVIPDGGCVRTFTDITALSAAQAEVASRNAMMQVMLENMRHGIALFDAHHRLLVANTLCARFNGVEGVLRPGMTRMEMAQAQAAAGEFGPPEAAAAMLEQLGRRDYAAPQAWQRTRPDGTVLEIRSNPVPGGGFVLTLTDVTDRVRAEEEVQRRAAVLSATLNAAKQSIVLYDAQGVVRAANAQAAELCGYADAAAMVGQTAREVVEQQRVAENADAEAWAERAGRFALIDRSRPLRYQRRRADGRVLEIASDPLPGGGYVVTVADVTELVEAREQAQRRAAVLAAALNASRHALVLYDAGQRVLAANRMAAEIAGFPDEHDMIGVSLEEVLQRQAARESPGDSAARRDLLEHVLRIDRSLPHRYQRRHPDGRIFDVQSDPTPDGGFAVSVVDVTALARAREEAQHRAGILGAMIENNRHGIVLYGADHRLVAANALAGEMMGVADLLARPGTPHEVILAAQLARGMYADAEGGRATERSFRDLDRTRPQRAQRTLPDGRRFDIASDPTPDGGFVISIADVTALARAEAEAEQRAGVLQTMLDNIQLGILLYDRDRRLAGHNELAAVALGVPDLAALRGRPMREVLARQLAAGNFGEGPEAEALCERLATMDRSVPQFHQRVTRDGRVLNNASHPTPDGGFVISITDVTPLARAQAEAARRAEILGVMLDNIRHGIALFDAGARIVAVNPMLHTMLDLPPSMLGPGTSIAEMVELLRARGEYGEGERGERAAALILSRPRSEPVRSTRRRPDGSIFEVVSDPTPDGGFVVTYTDVTEDRRIREELEGARAAAESASLAKSRFLATMSHELRTPLNAVIGFSEVLRGEAPPEQTQEFALAIQEAGRHLLSLIDDILDVTRAESGSLPVNLERLAVGPLLDGVARMMREGVERAQLHLEVACAPGLPALRADERRLRQVLLNLVTNAQKFTPPGGRITLAARREEAGLVIEVRDTGIGIAPADLPRVFEPFTQLDSHLTRRYPGAGLGLYLCRVLTEAQGGSLSLDSAAGKGTCAMLRFPASSLLPET